MRTVRIHTEHITLGQFLKYANIIATGGEAKAILQEGLVRVDGNKERRRGRKLYPGMRVDVDGLGSYRVESDA